MTTTQVFRIVHPLLLTPEGVPAGPYNAYAYAPSCDCDWDEADPECLYCPTQIANEALYTLDEHDTPTPDRDGIRFRAGEDHSGFANLDQLINWFGDILDLLGKCGFEIHIFETDEVQIGGHQVAFPAQRSRLVDRMPC